MVKLFGCTKQFCILQLPIFYIISLIMVTITKHIFINIFQTEHFSGVRFAMGFEKNMGLLVIAKSPKVWKKKLEKIGLGSFNKPPRWWCPVFSMLGCILLLQHFQHNENIFLDFIVTFRSNNVWGLHICEKRNGKKWKHIKVTHPWCCDHNSHHNLIWNFLADFWFCFVYLQVHY